MPFYAHRGVSAHLPENTLSAFARAIDLGVTGIELDVHLSADRVPVVHHDDTVDRTTNGTGRISEFTAKELSLLDAGLGDGVPTLAQVLSLAAGKLRVNIELKDSASAPAVAAVVAKVPGLDWFASSADWNALVHLAGESRGAKLYPLCVSSYEQIKDQLPQNAGAEEFTGRNLEAALDFARDHACEGVSIWEAGLTPADIATIHEAGLKAWVWTINDPQRARQLLDMGADGICTDDPQLLQEALMPVRGEDYATAARSSNV